MREIQTLHELPRLLKEFGAKPAVVALMKERKEQWAYEKLAKQSARLAAGLVKSGVQKGDHIALVAENRPQWMAACLGIFAAGGVAVPIDVQLESDALRHVLHDSAPDFVFTTERLLDRVQPAIGRRRCELLLLDGATT